MLEVLLEQARRVQASDLHLCAGEVPLVRVQGCLQSLSEERLAAKVLEEVLTLLPQEQLVELKQLGEVDWAWSCCQGRRYRMNVYRQQGKCAVAIRLLAEQIPSCEELGLPTGLCQMAALDKGLVIVAGPTGSGKSTTLAALVQRINETRAVHVISLEDPIEYHFTNKLAMIHQRQVGRDTEDFASGLRSALRQDPDVIMVGEMRDGEAMSIALTAAETGHLVLATLHTGDVVSSINRIIDALPDRQQQVRSQLAECLQGVVCQRLLPRRDGKGRVAAFELLQATDAVRALIREGNSYQLPSFIQTGSRIGMVTMESSIAKLRKCGLID